MRRYLFIAIVTSAISPSFVFAAQCDPKQFMSQDVDYSHSSYYFRLLYARSITQERFEELKKQGKISTIIPDTTLPIDISYSDFKKLVSSQIDSSSSDITQAQTETMFKSRLSSEAAQMYADCLRTHQIYTDLEVPENASSLKKFFVILTWHGPVGKEKGKIDIVGRDRFQILGGDVIDRDAYNKTTEIQNGESLRFPVQRDLDDDFSMSMSVDGHSSQVDLPRNVKPNPIIFETIKSSDVSAYGDGLHDGEKQICVTAKSDQEFLTSTARVVDTDRQIPSSGHVASFLVGQPTPQIVCIGAKANVDDKKQAASITSHLEIIAVKKQKTDK